MEFTSPVSTRFPSRASGAKYLPGTAFASVPPPTGKHVLIIDDDLHFRNLFKVMLAQSGFPLASIREAEDSYTAIAYCREDWREDQLDVVFCDLNLSRIQPMNGIGTVHDIRRLRPRLPVYMITAENNSEVIEKVCRAGATGHILKPLNLRVVKRVLTATFPFSFSSL